MFAVNPLVISVFKTTALEGDKFWRDVMWGVQVYCFELPICCPDTETPEGRFVLPSLPLAPFQFWLIPGANVFVCAHGWRRVSTCVCACRCRSVFVAIHAWVLTWLLMCQTDPLWPEPNKVSSPVCGLWGRLCVSSPRGRCHAGLKLLEQSADSTWPGQIEYPQPLWVLDQELFCLPLYRQMTFDQSDFKG